MSYRSINQSGCVRLRPYYILIILLILNGCKSDCEKAAAFSVTDYDNMSEALEQQAIINLKCKNEIDNTRGLNEKTAAQKYCRYTKDCSEINRIKEEEERIVKEKKEKAERIASEKTEEKLLAIIAKLDSEIKQKCPIDPNLGELSLAKELTTDQRRECYDLVGKFNSLSNEEINLLFWQMCTMVYGVSAMDLFLEYRETGVSIGIPICYSLTTEDFYGYLGITFAVANNSESPVYISKRDVSFYINGEKEPNSSIQTDFDVVKRIGSGEQAEVSFVLKLKGGYHTYEDLVSENVKVYFNKDTIGKARLFPTAGPLDANDDIKKSKNASVTLIWNHAIKKYTSNDWLTGVSGVDSFKYAKVYDSSAIIEEMKKAGIFVTR